MTEIIHSTDFHNTTTRSDAVYHVAIFKHGDGTYSCIGLNGARGKRLTRQNKELKTSLTAAQETYNKVLREKYGKSYRNVPGITFAPWAGILAEFNEAEGTTSSSPSTSPSSISEKIAADLAAKSQPSTPTPEFSGHVPQQSNSISEEDLEKYLTDDEWGAMEKMDGERRMVEVKGKTFKGINKKGYYTTFPHRIAEAIKGVGINMLIDGEEIGDTLYCFGLLEAKDVDLRNVAYMTTHRRLSNLLKDHVGNGLEVVQLAMSTEEKRALFNKLKAEDKEGIIFRRLASPYTPNRPSSGGDSLKFKFVESASCVVVKQNVGKRSVKLQLFSETTPDWVDVGNVTVPVNHEMPEPADVVEVQYLYAYRGGSLFQPVYKGKRTDIEPKECTLAQLKYTNKNEASAAAA